MIDILGAATLVLGVILFLIALFRGVLYLSAAVAIILILFAVYSNKGSVDVPTSGEPPMPNPFSPIGPFGLWINA